MKRPLSLHSRAVARHRDALRAGWRCLAPTAHLRLRACRVCRAADLRLRLRACRACRAALRGCSRFPHQATGLAYQATLRLGCAQRAAEALDALRELLRQCRRLLMPASKRRPARGTPVVWRPPVGHILAHLTVPAGPPWHCSEEPCVQRRSETEDLVD